MNVLVWQIHGSYLNTLVKSFAGGPHRFCLPTKPDKPEGYGGRGPTFPWSDETVDVPAEEVRNLDLDLIVYQSEKNFVEDAREILTPEQRALPAIFLEHNTPQGRINEMVHPIDDPGVLLVHVTHFNDLPRRRRVVGGDVFLRARERVPLDLFGFNSLEVGGFGDLPQAEVHERMKPYRFYFNPIRYTSLPLSVLEAMEIGLPVVALATTELVTVIKDGENGFIGTDVGYLIERMRDLLEDPDEARRLGEAGRRTVQKRFGLERFAKDWEAAFAEAVALREEVPCASR